MPHVAYGVSVDSWSGFSGGQLRLPLTWTPAAAGLGASIGAVCHAWVDDAAAGPATVARFGEALSRFIRYAAARGVTTLEAVDSELVAGFIAARQRGEGGVVTAPAVATMRLRRAALRAFFTTARQLRLTLDDPTPAIRVDVGRGWSAVRRPLTHDEATFVRIYAQRATPTRHAATVALLLAGAHTGETGHITTADLDLNAGIVHIAGSARYRARSLPLDNWAQCVLAARIDHLTHHQHATPSPVTLCTPASAS